MTPDSSSTTSPPKATCFSAHLLPMRNASGGYWRLSRRQQIGLRRCCSKLTMTQRSFTTISQRKQTLSASWKTLCRESGLRYQDDSIRVSCGDDRFQDVRVDEGDPS